VIRRFVAAAVFLSAFAAPAQPPSTKLLAFDVTAVDRRGNLVADLQASDFRVADGGRSQQIAWFRRGIDRTETSEALTGARSNYVYTTFPRTVVILLDQLNSPVELTGAEWREISNALGGGEDMRGIYFYLLTKNGALFPIHGFPDSWVAASTSSFSASEILPLFDEMRRRRVEQSTDLDASRSAQGDAHSNFVMKRKQLYTQNALQQLATRLSAVPGTKSIVWIGRRGRRPRDGDPTQAIAADWGDSIDAVPIYSLDTTIASTVGSAIHRALADTQRGYRIGYYPPAGNWDGRNHRVRIECKRSGVTIHAKAGYTAVRAVDVEDDRRQSDPDLLAVSPFDASTIRFRAAEDSGPAGRALDIRVAAEDILFHADGEAVRASLAVQAIQYRGDGEVEVLQDPLMVDLTLTPAQRVAAQREGLRVWLPVVASDSAVAHRVVVLDRATQSFGTLTIPARRKQP
jgi:VWFA-related protein